MPAPPSVPLAHHRTGRGAPLVLLHPLGADRHVWDPVVPRLAPLREVIAVDLPGFGQSPPLAQRPPTPRALAEALAEHLGSLGVARPHVAGNSLGGWVALELGLRRYSATPSGRSLLLSGSVADPRRVPAAAARHLVQAYGAASDFVAVNDAMRAGRFDGLEQMLCPVTFVWPDHDRLIRRPVWVPDRIRNVVLSDAGHVPMWDAPRPLAQVLLQATGGETADGERPSLHEELAAGEAS